MKHSYYSTDRGGRLHYRCLAWMNGKSVAMLKGYGPLYVIVWNPKNNTQSWYWEDKEGRIRSSTMFRRYDDVDYNATINDYLNLEMNKAIERKSSTNWLEYDYSRKRPDELTDTIVYHPNNLYKVFDKFFECDFLLHPEVLMGYWGYVKDNKEGMHYVEGLEKGIRPLCVDLEYSIEQMKQRKNVVAYKEDIRHWTRAWFLGGGQIVDLDHEEYYQLISCRLNAARKYHDAYNIMLDRHNIPHESWSLDSGDYRKTFDVEKDFDSRYKTEGIDTLLPHRLLDQVDSWVDRYLKEYP